MEHLLLEEFSKAENRAAEEEQIEEEPNEVSNDISDEIDRDLIEHDMAAQHKQSPDLERVSESCVEVACDIGRLKDLKSTAENLVNQDVDQTRDQPEVISVNETHQCRINEVITY